MNSSSRRAPAGLLSTALAAALAVACLVAPASAAAAGPSPTAQARSAVARLSADVRKLPRAAASSRTRAALKRAAADVSRNWRRRPCTALKAGKRVRSSAKRASGRATKRRGRLAGASWRGRLLADAQAIDAALKQLPRARSCGGAKAAPAATAGVDTTIKQASTSAVSMRVALPPAQLTARRAAGKDFTELEMGEVGAVGNGTPGDPAVPTFSRLVAVPRGAVIDVDVSNVSSYVVDGVTLYPAQDSSPDQAPAPDPQPPPSAFADPPFAFDARAYRSAAKVPAQPAAAAGMGQMRDLGVGALQLAGAQYEPRRRRLRVITGMDVTVKFAGANSGRFELPRARSAFEAPWERIYRSALDNYASVAAQTKSVASNQAATEVPECGEEFLIVTSPALRPAADTFADARRDAGFVVSVKETGSGADQAGATNEQIRTFIRSRLNAPPECVRPSYALLFGDTAHVPTFIEGCDWSPPCEVATDLSYSLDGVGTDPFPDVMLGRIPAPDLATADAVVGKIVGYETTPPAPAGDPFYNHATVTAFFEGPGPRDARGYTRSAEKVRAGLRTRGHVVDRLYTAAANAEIVEFNNGTPIPEELRRPAFPWNAGTTDFLNAWNDGRFMVLHRDHGWRHGWASPTLSVTNVPSMTNGTELPVAFGINCSSGQFDTPGNPSFAERILQRAGGGAAGVFAASRDSPSSENNHLAVGFADALFPDTMPEYGAPEPLRRMGEVLIAGQAAMNTTAGGGAAVVSAGERYNMQLYHYFGDPSMEMWVATPQQFEAETDYQGLRPIPPVVGDPGFRVQVTAQGAADGAIATLKHAGEVIGRGVLENGEVTLNPEVRTDSAQLTVSLERDGFIPKELPVAAPVPSLTMNCPTVVSNTQTAVTFSGTLSPPVRDALVRLKVTRPNGTTFTTSDLTDSSSAWSANVSLLPSPAMPGTWKVEAFFDGENKHGEDHVVCEFTIG